MCSRAVDHGRCVVIALWKKIRDHFFGQKPPSRLARLAIENSLVDRIAVILVIHCPCGAPQRHRLVHLQDSAQCPQCHRHLAIREFVYRRPDPTKKGELQIFIGHLTTKG